MTASTDLRIPRAIAIASAPAVRLRYPSLKIASASTVAVAAHPGVSNTELVRHTPAPVRALMDRLGNVLTQPAAMGALPTLRAATDPAVLGGQYFGPGGPGESRGYPRQVASSEQSHDLAVQQRLWAVSEELTGVRFPV